MTQTVYIPVDKKADYYLYEKYDENYYADCFLEKHENVYVFTPEQLLERDKQRDKQIAGDAFDAGYEYTNPYGLDSPILINKTEYLNNLKS